MLQCLNHNVKRTRFVCCTSMPYVVSLFDVLMGHCPEHLLGHESNTKGSLKKGTLCCNMELWNPHLQYGSNDARNITEQETSATENRRGFGFATYHTLLTSFE